MLNNEAQSDSHPAIWEANALVKDEIYLFPSLFEWVSAPWGNLQTSDTPPLSVQTPPNEVSDLGSPLCPVITVNSAKTRPPELKLKAGFILSAYVYFSLSL